MNEEPRLEILIEEGDDGGYHASAPILPGCAAQGKTVEEALANMKEAIKSYLEVLMQEVLINAKKQGMV